MIDQFTDSGFYGPLKLLAGEECHALLKDEKKHDPLIPDWSKALAASSLTVYRIATQPAILGKVKAILGNDIMLWGASFVKRMPGQTHAWHNDIETSVAQGKTVSVWIGLKNTTRASGLQLISRSHAFKASIQEVRAKTNADKSHATASDVLAWAKEKDTACELVIPDMTDGDALFFDGWLWHASHHLGKRKRIALLLQYATPDTPIRIPDPNNFEWPFKTLLHPKPPCIMISGSDRFGVNRMIVPPTSHDGHEICALTSRIYSIPVPLTTEQDAGWKPFSIFRGSTPNLQSITCHASALNPGYTPHPQHHHREEEILMLLSGEADVTLPDLSSKGLSPLVSLKPGNAVYYPAWFYHTITAKGNDPANYLMLKWYNGRQTQGSRLEYMKISIEENMPSKDQEKPLQTKLVFQQETDCLNALQCHTTQILPGGGYAAHTDAHDVVIIVWKGVVQTLGERLGPMSVLFFPAGQLHDMMNPTDETAEYLVFEFHGNHPPPVKRKRKSLWQKMRDPQSWRNKVVELRARFK